MKKFRLKKKTMADGFDAKMEKVFNDYFDWYSDPGEILAIVIKAQYFYNIRKYYNIMTLKNRVIFGF